MQRKEFAVTTKTPGGPDVSKLKKADNGGCGEWRQAVGRAIAAIRAVVVEIEMYAETLPAGESARGCPDGAVTCPARA
ncbi:hypothetical protein [Microbispora triticiradicis]|uniref:hypothetical protein n=1 Tax=Microbispora triticiradicis TaxID=2200763 RepID=UPI0010587FE9|nr:hypothetical protein [Microbispora triticiradicis]GLW23096.1 hypothetical protein Mame01_31390 [Microbispora amethystogenes]